MWPVHCKTEPAKGLTSPMGTEWKGTVQLGKIVEETFGYRGEPIPVDQRRLMDS